jgi:predicted ATPase/DNA-binding SARP family transcriptional activator/DNA-binding CsgD family transcriptional regulator
MTYSRRAARAKHDPRDAPGEGGGAPEATRVRLLGGFSVSVGLRTIEEGQWRLRKAANLVKLLALAPEHRLHREQVTELLWPDLAPKAAANNFHYALYHARHILEPALVTASCYLRLMDEQLMLCPDGQLWVDVDAFENAVVRVRRTHQPALYRAAIDLYPGDLLPRDRYEGWAEDRREGLRRLYLVLLLELAELYEGHEEFEPAIEVLGRAVAEEPTHEEAHVRLMRMYAASGQPHETIRQYARLRNTLFEELGVEPGEASQRLHEEVQAGRLPVARSPVQANTSVATPLQEDPCHNLPVERTSFVGREEELVEVKRLLVMTQLLTLKGAGGSGKTRLALEIVNDLVGLYPDGVWLVELAGLSEGELVPQAVAAALGVREQPNRPLMVTLVDSLRTKNLLLVLDNCEHLAVAVVRLVETLVGSCPGLRLLATSRETLGVAGELVWQVPPLSVPYPDPSPAGEELHNYESVRLFVERAKQRDPLFALTEQNYQGVARICQKLEGLPLAVELAAAQVGALSLEQIVERLEGSNNLLRKVGRAPDPRHQTLKRTLDWSYELLGEPERKLFRRLSVFAGGSTLEAAERVGTGEGIEETAVLEVLSQLIDKSLVVAKKQGEESAMRYRMLEPIRHYAREKLEKNREEAEATRRRHAAVFLALAEEAELELRGPRQGQWLAQLETEHDNLRSALSWALKWEEAELGLQLGGALGEFWHLRGHLSEGQRWLGAALEKEEALPGLARAKALARAGYIAWEQGDYERSVVLSEESLALSRKVGDTAAAAAALYTLGWAAMFGNEIQQASALIEEAVMLQRDSEDRVGVARSLLILGFVAVAQHNYEQAMALYEESVALAREVGDGFSLVLSLGVGALAALGQGDYQRTRLLCEEGLQTVWQLKITHLIAAYLHVAASLAGSQGLSVRAARLWGAAENIREAIGTVLSPFERHLYAPYIAAAQDHIEKEMWEAAWKEGRVMPLEEAIDYALSQEELSPLTDPIIEHQSSDKPKGRLTNREKEVAALVVQGLSSRQIAAELAISKHTVDTHVRKLLKKLKLRSRAQITAE